MRRERVLVNDLMQTGYAYFLTEPVGQNFAEAFDIPEGAPMALPAEKRAHIW